MERQAVTVKDPLLGCLEIICKLNNQPYSEQAIIAGLPITESGLSPSQFRRAAHQAGFSANLAEKPLKNISNMVLPAILILKGNLACVLTHVENDTAEVVFPENSNNFRKIPWGELLESYSGYTIYITHEAFIQGRTEDVHLPPRKSWFWGTVFRYKQLYVHVFIAALLSNIFILVAPVYIMNVYDRVIPNNDLESLWVLTIGALTFFVFDFIARNLRSYFVDTAGRKADILLYSDLFRKLLSLRMRQKPASSGGFASYFNEFEVLREFFTSATLVTLIDIPFVLLFIAVIYFIGGPIAFIPMVALPVVFIVGILMELPTSHAMKKALSGSTQKNSILVETIAGLETIKTLNAEGIMQRQWENSITAQSKAQLKSRMLSSFALNFSVFIQQVSLIAVIVTGVFLIRDHQLTIGGLVAVTIISGRVTMLGTIISLATRFARSRASLKALNNVMSLPQEHEDTHPLLHRPKLKGIIQFDRVNFLYPRRRIPALENVSFTINPGERVGIIGRIGAGKSTLIKLLLALYLPGSGSILVDGTDNTEIDPVDLRKNIGYSSNDSILFYGSVRDNILMGDPLASDDALIKVAQLTGVDNFVSQSPLGYDMPVGERGEGLSSGQRAAVVLARTLLSDPPILCLDEPTASMDNNYESDFLAKIPEYIKNKTLILITHRLSMLQMVDRIIVMEAGKVVADGPRDQILEAIKNSKDKSVKG